jgi:hypothetical protein
MPVGPELKLSPPPALPHPETTAQPPSTPKVELFALNLLMPVGLQVSVLDTLVAPSNDFPPPLNKVRSQCL